MAYIQERIAKDGKTKSYRVLIRLKGFPSQSGTFDRIKAARDWATATEAAIREGRYFKNAEAKRHTLNELIDRYIENIIPLKKSGSYQVPQLKWWKSQIGDYLLSDITSAMLVETRSKLAAKGIGGSGANRYTAALSHVFTIATKEWGWMEDNPMRNVSKFKEPRGRVRFLSDEERTELLKACKESSNPDLYPAVVLALSTGARKMEIWSLKWNNVDFERGSILIEDSKNNERRSIPLTGHALDIMRKRLMNRRLDLDYVFPGRDRTGKVVNKPGDIRRAWEEALKQSKVKDFRWHDLRHSAASYLAMNGATLAEIAEVLGHKTLSMVKRYSHLSEAHTAKVVESMNRKMFGSA